MGSSCIPVVSELMALETSQCFSAIELVRAVKTLRSCETHKHWVNWNIKSIWDTMTSSCISAISELMAMETSQCFSAIKLVRAVKNLRSCETHKHWVNWNIKYIWDTMNGKLLYSSTLRINGLWNNLMFSSYWIS